ncbi:MAG TPA: hypothetical protein VJ969_09580 [Desulfopila sp.]|nr:hypothetical protein [Desulfopila sp.]
MFGYEMRRSKGDFTLGGDGFSDFLTKKRIDKTMMTGNDQKKRLSAWSVAVWGP